MATSEARIRANQLNARRSTGPKTVEGKERSRANALKHGLTGAGVVMAEADAIEVRKRSETIAEETNAKGTIGLALARRAALCSVRMERGAEQQSAALSERLRQVDADFVAPEDVDEAEEARLRKDAQLRAMLDTSKEAVLARKYELAAERSFFRCLKELEKRNCAVRVEAKVKDPGDAEIEAELMGSFLQAMSPEQRKQVDLDAIIAEMGIPMPPITPKSPNPPTRGQRIDLAFSVGRQP